MRTIDVGKLSNSEMLIGRGQGQRDLPRFIEAAFAVAGAETILWDWSGIQIATASYFAAAFVPVMKMLISGDMEKYFVLAGLNENCRDELQFVLETEGLAIFLTEELKSGHIRSARPIGKLESPYAETLDRVIHHPGVSAKALLTASARARKGSIGQTAWINRLTALHNLRLITRKKVGKEYTYTVPYLEG